MNDFSHQGMRTAEKSLTLFRTEEYLWTDSAFTDPVDRLVWPCTFDCSLDSLLVWSVNDLDESDCWGWDCRVNEQLGASFSSSVRKV